VLDAAGYGPTPQRRPFGPVTTIPEPSIPGESTLNVNVFTPAPGDAEARLPVMVWIHGGGFFAGSPASPWYDGVSFNRDGVVTVSISYRLGFDGFGWIEDAPANRGVLDQIAALEWVQENIEVFGGDPRRVTIAGQSAGGSSVLTLLGTPRAQPLFARAIAQSGVARSRTLDAARDLGRRFAAQLGVEPTRAGWSTISEDQILDGQAELYAAPESDAAAEDRAVAMVRAVAANEPGGHLPFVPHVDGTVIVTGTLEAVADGVGGAKELLVGSNAHEFTMAMSPLREELQRCEPETLLAASGLDPAATGLLLDHFAGFDTAWLLGQLMTERMFRLPLLDVVEARLADGRAGTWLFDFRWVSPALGLATHCLELPFTWDLLGAPGVLEALGAGPPAALAEAMHRAWVGFVSDGDPGWPACSVDLLPGMVFGEESQWEPHPYRLEAEMRRVP